LLQLPSFKKLSLVDSDKLCDLTDDHEIHTNLEKRLLEGSSGVEDISEEPPDEAVIVSPQGLETKSSTICMHGLNEREGVNRLWRTTSQFDHQSRVKEQKDGDRTYDWVPAGTRGGGNRQGRKQTNHLLQNRGLQLPPPPPSFSPRTSPFTIILVGIPGSGKSTFARALASLPQSSNRRPYVRINQDELKTRRKCESRFRSVLSLSYACPIIDRCNFDLEQRSHFLKIACEFNPPIECHYVVFQIGGKLCISRCCERVGHETIAPKDAHKVVKKMKSMFNPPKEAPSLPPCLLSNLRRFHVIKDPQSFSDVLGYYSNL